MKYYRLMNFRLKLATEKGHYVPRPLQGISFWSSSTFITRHGAKEIDASIDTALDRFKKEVPSAKELLSNTTEVIKVGIGIGGEYGVGALRVTGKIIKLLHYDYRIHRFLSRWSN